VPQTEDSALEARNLEQIERLNQRGGRTLSVVDLIDAGTVDANVAGFLLYAVAHGASFLTAARPGNAGKSTVLANLLGFLPPGTRIVCAEGLTQQRQGSNNDDRMCALAHEIGSGPYYGYIWGHQVRDFFGLMRKGHAVASCIHADALEELTQILTDPPLMVQPATLAQLDLILFMRLSRSSRGWERRVGSIYETPGSSGSTHQLLFSWDQAGDRLVRRGPSVILKRIAASAAKPDQQVNEEVADCSAFIRRLRSERIVGFRAIRREVVRFLGRAEPG
jgi:hypothetical protein